MKFLSFVFCAAALTAGTAYGMKTPTTAPKAPQTEITWQGHALRSAAKTPGFVIGAAVTLMGAWASLVEWDLKTGLVCTLLGLSIAVPTFYSLKKSVIKAHTLRKAAQKAA